LASTSATVVLASFGSSNGSGKSPDSSCWSSHRPTCTRAHASGMPEATIRLMWPSDHFARASSPAGLSLNLSASLSFPTSARSALVSGGQPKRVSTIAPS
jgi:hypothetical protein